MRPEDLVFWLDVLRDDSDDTTAVLCRRHADSMVVPRNWTLDDLRDPDLHLFRPPERAEAPARTRRPRARASDGEQLALGVDDGDASGGDGGEGEARSDAAAAPPAAKAAGGDDVGQADDQPADAWTPTFDDGDDLDGLLAARSPLLARAFRGTDRPSS